MIASGGVGKLEHFGEGAVLGKAQGLLAASVFIMVYYLFKM